MTVARTRARPRTPLGAADQKAVASPPGEPTVNAPDVLALTISELDHWSARRQGGSSNRPG